MSGHVLSRSAVQRQQSACILRLIRSTPPRHFFPCQQPFQHPLFFVKRNMTGGKSDPHDLSKGDDVSWSWGSQNPKGTVKEVKDDGAEAKTKKGSTISKDGSSKDPAVVIETSNGNNAVKNVSRPVCSMFVLLLLTMCMLLSSGIRDRWCQALGCPSPHELVLCTAAICVRVSNRYKFEIYKYNVWTFADGASTAYLPAKLQLLSREHWRCPIQLLRADSPTFLLG